MDIATQMATGGGKRGRRWVSRTQAGIIFYSQEGAFEKKRHPQEDCTGPVKLSYHSGNGETFLPLLLHFAIVFSWEDGVWGWEGPKVGYKSSVKYVLRHLDLPWLATKLTLGSRRHFSIHLCPCHLVNVWEPCLWGYPPRLRREHIISWYFMGG